MEYASFLNGGAEGGVPPLVIVSVLFIKHNAGNHKH